MPIKRIRCLSILPKAGAQPKRRSAWEAIKKGSSAGSTAFAQSRIISAAPLSTVWERQIESIIKAANSSIYMYLGRKILFIFKRYASLAWPAVTIESIFGCLLDYELKGVFNEL